MNSNKKISAIIKRACYLCNCEDLQTVEVIKKRPALETDFGIEPSDYLREIMLCERCGLYNNFHNYDFEKIYSGKYNKDTYDNSILAKYNAIMNLPPEKSDNQARVKRIRDFCAEEGLNLKDLSVLDVGSGLSVFLGELLKYGVKGYCIDPDPVSIEHAIRNVKVSGVFRGTFMEHKLQRKFDIIAFNKVLEHVKDPVSLLKKARQCIERNGFVYIELPDGEAVLRNNLLKMREEFFIEHYTIFSERSMKFLSEVAGFTIMKSASIIENSGKYTLFSFIGMKA